MQQPPHPQQQPPFYVHPTGPKVTTNAALAATTAASAPSGGGLLSRIIDSQSKRRRVPDHSTESRASRRRQQQQQQPTAAPIESSLDGPLAGVVQINRWPFQFNTIQRQDGVALDPETGQRAYRSTKRYPEEWVRTQLDRIYAKMRDEVYSFMSEVAGNCDQSVENDFFDEARARSTVSRFSQATGGGARSERATSSPLSVADMLSRGSRMIDNGAYSKTDIRIEALKALGKGPDPLADQSAASSALDDNEIVAGATVNQFVMFLMVFAFVTASDDPLGDVIQPEPRGEELRKLARLIPAAGHNSSAIIGTFAELEENPARLVLIEELCKELSTSIRQYYELGQNHPAYDAQAPTPLLRVTDSENDSPETQAVRWKVSVGYDNRAFAEPVDVTQARAEYRRNGWSSARGKGQTPSQKLRALIEEANATSQSVIQSFIQYVCEPTVSSFFEDVDRMARQDGSMTVKALIQKAKSTFVYRFFVEFGQHALKWYEQDERAITLQLERVESERTRISGKEYERQRAQWEDQLRKNTTEYTQWYITVNEKLPPASREESRERFNDLIYQTDAQGRKTARMPTVDEVRAWDLVYNRGRLNDLIEEQQRRISEVQPDTPSDIEWVSLVENLGMMFMKEIFRAALNRALFDVQSGCGNGHVFYLDLMTHENVHTPFAVLVARHVQMIRANNMRRPYPEWFAKRLRDDVTILKALFKHLRYDDREFLYFAGVQSPELIEYRRTLEARRQDFTERTGLIYSDRNPEVSSALGSSVWTAPSGRQAQLMRMQQQQQRPPATQMSMGAGAPMSIASAMQMAMGGGQRRQHQGVFVSAPAVPLSQLTGFELSRVREEQSFVDQAL